VYPNSLLPEIMSYQLAIEIRRKQNLDVADKEMRKMQLIQTMLKQIDRDEARAESPRNSFSQGFSPYI